MCLRKAALLVVLALASATETGHRANPIRKVVTMLQMMQNKVEAEGKKAKELYDKFACYCEGSEGALTSSIGEAKDKIPQLESSIKESTEQQKQLSDALVAHKSTRAAAEEAIAKATAMRKNEAADFAKESSQSKANIEALSKAIPAIEKGMGGFLQTSAAGVLRKLILTADLDSDDREEVAAFLSQSNEDSDSAPGSGEILGILKTMKEEMEKDLADLIAQEETAISAFNGLIAAKQKEIAAATKAIEEKTVLVGEISVELATMKNDLEDTEEQLEEDEKMIIELKKSCAIKKKEFEARQKAMGMELVALADTIKMLNDDDALDLFKKTIPSASAASFIQLDLTSEEVRSEALQVLRKGRNKHSLHRNFIALALHGKQAGFEKVITMIDNMIALLGKEQAEDDKKKAYCEAEFDKTEDKQKVLTKSISDVSKEIAEQEDVLGTLTEEIAALKKGIAELDKSVAVATQQRKKEHAIFTEDLAANNAAKELIEMAKNRMQKFYNPKLYKAPPKRELSEQDRITLNMGGTLAPTEPPGGIAGTGIGAFEQAPSFAQLKAHSDPADYVMYTPQDAPTPPAAPPALFEYSAKKADAGGALAMMDNIIQGIAMDINEMNLEEKDSQEDYEATMADAAAKRATDSKAVTEKEDAKAELDAEYQLSKDAKKSDDIELAQTDAYMADLHEDCDWLLQNYADRQQARINEVDAMKKCKDVLSGADSFLQTSMSVQRLRKH